MSQGFSQHKSYPAFLRLAGRHVLVVGAGTVAAQKIPLLLASGARVTVVATAISPAFLRAVEAHVDIAPLDLTLLQRAFVASDLDGKWLAIAAAPPEVNARVAHEAEARRVFVNAVDDVAAATVHLGGVVERGGVTIAFSTGAQAPALAGLLREALEELLPDDVGDWIALARALRDRWRSARVPMAERRPLLLSALVERYAKRGAA